VVIMQCLPVGQSPSLLQTQWGPQSTVPPQSPLAQSPLLEHDAPTAPLPEPPEPHAPSPTTTATAQRKLFISYLRKASSVAPGAASGNPADRSMNAPTPGGTLEPSLGDQRRQRGLDGALIKELVDGGELPGIHVRGATPRTSMPRGGFREETVSEYWLTEAQSL
jgi:hypothetical protein